MIEWKKDSGEEGLDEAHYSHLAKQNANVLGGKSKIPFIIVGAVIIILLALFFKLNPKPPQNKFPDVRPLEARLAILEERMNKLEALKDQIKNLEDQVRINSETQASQQQLMNSVKANSEAIAEVQKKINAMAPGAKAAPEKARVSAAEHPQTPKKIQEAKATRPAGGEKSYHTVQKGETLFRISQKYGLSLQKLQELNGLGAKPTIYTGQKLIVGPAEKSR